MLANHRSTPQPANTKEAESNRKTSRLSNKTFAATTLTAPAGKAVVIPPKVSHRHQCSCDRQLYQARHLIENSFARLKQYRAIATRYDKTARNFLEAIHWAAAVVWVN